MPRNAKADARECLNCGYNLAGLSHDICPECGSRFDPQRCLQRARRRRWVASALTMTLVYYGPYAWLILSPWPWSEHRWSWIQGWLALPLAILVHVANRKLGMGIHDTTAFIITSAASVGLLWGLIWLAARRWWVLPLVAVLVLLISAFNSVGLYNVYAA